MKELRALWRPALPGRAGMVLAVGLLSGMARVAGAFAGGHWRASVHQASAVLLSVGVLVPIFAGMLGANLLRGENVSWAWVLARPRSRFKLIGSLVLLDVATILVCVGMAALVLGALKPAWFSWSKPAWFASLGGGYVAMYLVAATGGARTGSSIRAIVAGLFLLVVSGGCLYGAVVSLMDHGLPGIDGVWLHAVFDRAPLTIEAYSLWHPLTWWLFAAIAALAAIPIGLCMGFVRAVRRIPGRVDWTELASTPLALWGLAATLGLVGVGMAWLGAPSQAIDDNIELTVARSAVDEDIEAGRVWIAYESPIGRIERRQSSRERASRRGIRMGSARFPGLGAGRYVACTYYTKSAPTRSDADRRALYRRCVPFELAAEATPRVTIELGAGSTGRFVRYLR